jgi:predicted MFS family arabinose efflux permease
VLSVLRRNRDFRLLFLAQIVSYAGDWFATVAMLGLVRDRTGSDLLATLVFVAQTLPAFVLSPLTGPVADRIDRRTIMIVTSVLQVGAALLFLGAQEGPIVLAFVAQASISALAAFFSPASQAMLPNVVSEDDLPAATALMSATWGVMLAAGAGLGGIVTVLFGRTTAFVANAVSFAVAAALIVAVRHRRATVAGGRPPFRPVADTVDGLRYARGNRAASVLLLSKAGFGLSAGLVGLLSVLATGVFGTGDGGVGALLAARGVGVAIGPFIAKREASRGLSRMLWLTGVAAIVNGAMYAVVPWTGALVLAVPLVFVAHLAGGTNWTLSTYGLQVTTTDEYRGRIFATDFALVTLAMTLSLSIAGAVSDAWGPQPTMTLFGVVSVGWGLLYLTLTRTLRDDMRATG